jgi:hypothetical protein
VAIKTVIKVPRAAWGTRSGAGQWVQWRFIRFGIDLPINQYHRPVFFCAYRFSLTLNLKFKFQPILMIFGERTGFEPVLIFETFQGVHLPPRPARPLQRRWRAISNCEIEASNNVRM